MKKVTTGVRTTLTNIALLSTEMDKNAFRKLRKKGNLILTEKLWGMLYMTGSDRFGDGSSPIGCRLGHPYSKQSFH